MTEDITDDDARKVVEKILNNPNFEAGHTNNQLVIQRFFCVTNTTSGAFRSDSQTEHTIT